MKPLFSIENVMTIYLVIIGILGALFIGNEIGMMSNNKDKLIYAKKLNHCNEIIIKGVETKWKREVAKRKF